MYIIIYYTLKKVIVIQNSKPIVISVVYIRGYNSRYFEFSSSLVLVQPNLAREPRKSRSRSKIRNFLCYMKIC